MLSRNCGVALSSDGLKCGTAFWGKKQNQREVADTDTLSACTSVSLIFILLQ